MAQETLYLFRQPKGKENLNKIYLYRKLSYDHFN